MPFEKRPSRGRVVTMRMTEEEFDQIETQRQKFNPPLSVSDYIREAVAWRLEYEKKKAAP